MWRRRGGQYLAEEAFFGLWGKGGGGSKLRPGQKGDKLAFYHIGVVVALGGRDVASVGSKQKEEGTSGRRKIFASSPAFPPKESLCG